MRLPKMIRKTSKDSSLFVQGSRSSGSSGEGQSGGGHHDPSSISSSSSPSVGRGSVSVSVGAGSLSLREIQMEEEFEIIKTLAEGTFSKVYLAKRTFGGEKLVLKAVNSDLTSVEDFTREVNLTYFLSPHPATVTCYSVSFLWNNSFVFVQEQAPLGSLAKFISKKGPLGEKQVKLIAQQLSSALEFIHETNLVHRDVTLDNVLVFKANMSRVKLSDFGLTRAQGSLVLRTESTHSHENSLVLRTGASKNQRSESVDSWVNFAPPEICDLLPQEKYHCYSSSDVWQLGILIFKCLTGNAPWGCADITDPVYRQYTSWIRRKSLKIPEPLKPFTTRFLRLFKRLLEPKPNNRSEAREVKKYLKDEWVRVRRSGSFSSSTNGDPVIVFDPKKINAKPENIICNSNNIQCVHNKEKNLKNLKDYGLNTEIDKNRVEDWIATSSNSSSSSEQN